MVSCSNEDWIYTSSTLDMSNGFMYSKPSNSVWSIVPNTSLQGERRGEGKERRGGGEGRGEGEERGRRGERGREERKRKVRERGQGREILIDASLL